ncbi:MAG: zinc ribbon domain-containing protein [Thermoplasmata archaeon]
MSDLTSTEIILIALVVVLGVVVVAVLLFMMRRLRQRRAQLLHDLTDRPDLIQDRAFNRLGMARREAELLSRQGADVGRARELIAQSQAAFDNRNYEKAYQSAQMAHESLVDARRKTTQFGPLPGGAPPRPAAGTPAAAPGPTPTPRATPAATPTPSAMPRNRAESQFQLHLLNQELETARQAQPRAAATIEANDLKTRGQAAFDRADFTEAFRLALKGRRALGGAVEALPPTPATHSEGAPLPNGGAGTASLDAAQTAERVAGGEHCPECGYPALAGDAFCRGCGTPRVPSTCLQCGAPRTPADTFCGRCGAMFG